MKATELRIGNYIIYNGCLKFNENDVNIINGGNIHKMEQSIDYREEYEPIPLTEEWLLRFGFKKDTAEHCYMHKGFPSGIYFVIDAEWAICGDFNECTYIRLPKYVHQLQNLYFALTENELTIKTEKK